MAGRPCKPTRQTTNKQTKQTILKSEQGHKKYVTIGQQINRHADRPNVFSFFPTALFLKPIWDTKPTHHPIFVRTQKQTGVNAFQ